MYISVLSYTNYVRWMGLISIPPWIRFARLEVEKTINVGVSNIGQKDKSKSRLLINVL